SLLEGLVFGARAGEAMAGPSRARLDWGSGRLRRCGPVGPVPTSDATGSSPQDGNETIPALAWRCLGLVRDAARLREAFVRTSTALARLPDGPPASLSAAQSRSLITVAHLMAVAALRREESRGGHYRSD